MVRQLSHDGDAVGDPRDFADRAACRNAACASALRRAYRRRAQRERTGERPVDPGSHHRWLSGPAGSGVPYPPGAGLVDQPEPQGDSPTETGGLGQWPGVSPARRYRCDAGSPRPSTRPATGDFRGERDSQTAHLVDRTAESVAFSRPRRRRGRSGARTSRWSGLRHRGQGDQHAASRGPAWPTLSGRAAR
ncbi:Uncharacterised protein [Mycobacterium tuberculosis]|uniref:Uncharacterized protein n=1 Tax=Mycobacterium tuberculosis TaxID=1773 RepID=A0A655A3J5_MYCTX|nr:Uncharacterised protein [Mycobacterium tuberculosis]CKR76199.1 Uncharacterised protein [Mycobacterium tuberculosis]SGO86316.1 Uncharacterised protein [Mycobacterium tuberculosis]